MNLPYRIRFWPAWKLKALHRAAKRSGMFRDPRDMVTLRRWSVDAQIKEINDAIAT